METMTCAPFTKGVLHAARELMSPRWKAIHQSDIVWNRSKSLPEPISTAMCRHASAFLLRALKDAQRAYDLPARGWTVAKGSLSLTSLPTVPPYAQRNTEHFVLLGRDGQAIDATADQFGLDPLKAHDWRCLFTGLPQPTRPGLEREVRGWILHPAYPAILEEMGKSR